LNLTLSPFILSLALSLSLYLQHQSSEGEQQTIVERINHFSFLPTTFPQRASRFPQAKSVSQQQQQQQQQWQDPASQKLKEGIFC